LACIIRKYEETYVLSAGGLLADLGVNVNDLPAVATPALLIAQLLPAGL
jgi:hypothetical protein